MPVTEKRTKTAQGWSREDLETDPHINKDKAKRVEAMFSSIAGKYDLNNRLHSLWRDQHWRKRTVELAQLKGDECVVDVACGTGDLAMAFQKAGVKSVLGIDFTPEMLEIAKAKAANAKVDIEYQLGDAMSLELPDASADVVSIAFGIRNVQEPSRAIAEFHRILRGGGTVLVLEFSRPPNPIIRFFNNIYTKWIMPITATIISGDSSGAYNYLPKSVETFTKASELAEQLEAAGFSSVVQVPQTFGVCTITRATKM